MAYTFNGSNQYITTASAPVTAAPLTMAAWANPVNTTANHTILTIGDVAGDVDYWRIYAAGADAGDFAKFDCRRGAAGLQTASSSIAYTANTWQHYCGVAVSATDRTMYLDGGNTGTNTVSTVPANLDIASIGRLERLSATQYFAGALAEVALWSAALTAGEVLALSKRVSPLLIRPQSLVFYVPLVRELIGWKGFALTANNSPTVSAHPAKLGT